MSILDKVKSHISNNRGKYGAVAGAGTAYGLSQLPEANQAAFNVISRGQNLALDTADKIGYGKEQLQQLGLEKTDPKYIDVGNKLYDSGVNINPVDLSKSMAATTKLMDDYNNTVSQLGGTTTQDYLHKYLGVHENTNIGSKMKIEIKKALLEGTLPEQIITEAKHAGTPYEKGTPLGTLNRPILNNSIRYERSDRDYERSIGAHSDANYSDNRARLKSQMGETSGWNLKLGGPYHQGQQKGIAAGQQPRLYQAAKK